MTTNIEPLQKTAWLNFSASTTKLPKCLHLKEESSILRAASSASPQKAIYVLQADVIPIGSRGPKSGTWLWGWANPSIKAQADASA